MVFFVFVSSSVKCQLIKYLLVQLQGLYCFKLSNNEQNVYALTLKMNTPPVKQNQVKLGHGPENKKIDSTELRPLSMRGRMRVNSRILNMKLGHILQMVMK